MKRICTPFLSEQEVGSILKGADLWMDSDEIQRRLQKMAKARQPAKAKLTAKPRRKADE